jgi:hypothetical protein
MLMIWRLADLFKKEGHWTQEMIERLNPPAEVS